MGLVLALAGAIFTAVLWTSYQRASTTRSWVETPATLQSAQVQPERVTPNSPMKYRVLVKYSYRFADKDYTGHRIRQVDGPTGDLDKANRLRESYLPGQTYPCWVNPQQPDFAVLQHGTRAGLYSIWFPLLFVIGGLRMAWDAWQRLGHRKAESL